MNNVHLMIHKMAPEIDPIVEKIGSFRQYCIYTRRYLYSKTSPHLYLLHVAGMTYRVIQRIGGCNSDKYWDECKKIIGTEIETYKRNEFEKAMDNILN